MRVLFLDLLSPAGHVSLDRNLIEALGALASVDVACRDGYFDEGEMPGGVQRLFCIPTAYYSPGTKVTFRVKCHRAIRWVLRNVAIESYDLVFVSAFETISFSLSWPSRIRPRVAILHHNNLDELQNCMKAAAFRLIAAKVEHVVFSEDSASYLRQSFGIKNPIWLLHHPIDLRIVEEYRLASGGTSVSTDSCPTVVAPSSSNDEVFIKDLIQLDKNGCLDGLGIRIIAKSRSVAYESAQVRVNEGPFARKDYVRLMGDATLVLLPYPPSFRHRVSGVLFDALAFGKRFVGSDIPLFRGFARTYPGIGITYTDTRSIPGILKSACRQIYSDRLFDQVRKDHSQERVRKDLELILEGTACKSDRGQDW